MTKYYFLGIGGIGMSAIARYFNCKGYKVGGYDRVCSQLCLDLQKEGIDIHYTDLNDNIPTRNDCNIHAGNTIRTRRI